MCAKRSVFTYFSFTLIQTVTLVCVFDVWTKNDHKEELRLFCFGVNCFADIYDISLALHRHCMKLVSQGMDARWIHFRFLMYVFLFSASTLLIRALF